MMKRYFLMIATSISVANSFDALNYFNSWKVAEYINPSVSGFGGGEVYIFNGIGNWDVPTNWSNTTIPPSTLPAGSEIIINPSGDNECILNVAQVISTGAKLTVVAGKKFVIGDLNILEKTGPPNK